MLIHEPSPVHATGTGDPKRRIGAICGPGESQQLQHQELICDGLEQLNAVRIRTCWNGSWTNPCVARFIRNDGDRKLHHKFAKHLAFGSGGHLRSNDPADQEKAIVYNELVTNAVALQNVVDQTQALHMLKAEGVSIRPADLAFLSPYATSKLKRFGDYPTDLKPVMMPTCTALPI